MGDEAHCANLDLCTSLLKRLSSVNLLSLDVARFFVLGRHRPRTYYADPLNMPIGM